MKHFDPEDNEEHMAALKEFKENPEVFINRARANIVVGIWETKKKLKRMEYVVYSKLDGAEWTIGYLSHLKTNPQFHTFSFLPFYDKPNCLVINGKVFKVDKDAWDDKLSVDQIKIAINYLELILTTEGLDG